MKAWIGKLTLFISGLIILSTILIILRLPDDTLNALATGIIISFAALLLIFGSYICTLGYIFVRSKKIDIDHKELQANIVHSGGDAWVRERIILPDGTITIEWARLGGTRLRVNSHDHLPTQSEILYAHTMMKSGQQSKMIADGKSGIETPKPVELLPMLDRVDRCLVQGASDAGKSTLLCHIVQRSKGVILIDPHFTPDEWPIPDKQVIGKARNFAQVDKTLERLMAELNKRYNQRAQGITDFEPITIVIDEFMTIKDECKRAGKILSTLVRESRKVNFRLFIASHSRLVDALGLKGLGDVREGLVMVKLEIDQITKERVCTIDGQAAYFPPFGSVAPDLVLTDEEARIMAAYEDGKSLRQISQEVWGQYGAYYNERIREVVG